MNSLQYAQAHLGWPHANAIFSPTGQSHQVHLGRARQRLASVFPARTPKIGLLTPNPNSDSSAPPVAIVAQFAETVTPHLLRQARDIVWNLSVSPLFIALEPDRLRGWSAWEASRSGHSREQERGAFATLELGCHETQNQSLSQTPFHWLSLVTRQFLRDAPHRFTGSKTRVDHVLLSNLRFVTEYLREQALAPDLIADLLTRVTFLCYAWQRRDSSGRALLNPEVFRNLHSQGHLSEPFEDLPSVLASHEDAFSLFRWCGSTLGGDLFTRSNSCEDAAQAVRIEHMRILSDFASGRFEMQHGQSHIWPYRFDSIPLELISIIYGLCVEHEARDVYYTPNYIADFMLDSLIHWASEDWDINVVDPCCGSGPFLVNAFQRLVHRWKRAHVGKRPNQAILQRLLCLNLRGIDIDRHALQVAALSLYLCLCDELLESVNWDQVVLPPLIGQTLLNQDFFALANGEPSNRRTYVVGNVPWGRRQEKHLESALRWSRGRGWDVVNKSVDLLFLPAVLEHFPQGSAASLLLSARSFLYNRSKPHQRFRETFFGQYSVDEICCVELNLLLGQAKKVEAAIVSVRTEAPRGESITYYTPRPGLQEAQCILIDPYDVHSIEQHDAQYNPDVWVCLCGGSTRHLELIRRLRAQGDTLQQLQKPAFSRVGIERGKATQKRRDDIVGLRILECDQFPNGTFLTLDASKLPINRDPYVHTKDGSDIRPFYIPQLIMRRGFVREAGRYRAAIVIPAADSDGMGCACSRAYVTVGGADQTALKLACLMVNSRLAVFYFGMTSFRKDEPLTYEFLELPIPPHQQVQLDGITLTELDALVEEAFGLNEGERLLVEDYLDSRTNVTNKNGKPLADAEYARRQYIPTFEDAMDLAFGMSCGKSIDIVPFQQVLVAQIWLGLDGRVAQAPRDSRASIVRNLQDSQGSWQGRVGWAMIERGPHDPLGLLLLKPAECVYWNRTAALLDVDMITAEVVRQRLAVDHR